MDDAGRRWRFDPATGTVFGRDVRPADRATGRRRASRGRTAALPTPRSCPRRPRAAEFTACPQLDREVTDVVADV
jgi:hypothetical protein